MDSHNRKYVFSAALRAELQAAYCEGKSHLSARLDKLERVTKWPRHAFLYEAQRLGITQGGHRRPWTAAEDARLAERLGTVSAKTIARELKRTIPSVIARSERLGLSRRVKDGYNLADLAEALGAPYLRVRGWVSRGLLGRTREWEGVRVGEAAVAEFIRRYPGEYDLRRVDETWFKAMVFGAGER